MQTSELVQLPKLTFENGWNGGKYLLSNQPVSLKKLADKGNFHISHSTGVTRLQNPVKIVTVNGEDHDHGHTYNWYRHDIKWPVFVKEINMVIDLDLLECMKSGLVEVYYECLINDEEHEE